MASQQYTSHSSLQSLNKIELKQVKFTSSMRIFGRKFESVNSGNFAIQVGRDLVLEFEIFTRRKSYFNFCWEPSDNILPSLAAAAGHRVRHQQRRGSRVQQFGIKVEQVHGAAPHNNSLHVSRLPMPALLTGKM